MSFRGQRGAACSCMLPSALAPEYADSGLHQTWEKLQATRSAPAFTHQLGYPSTLRGIWAAAGRCCWWSAGVFVRMWKALAHRTHRSSCSRSARLTIVGMIPAARRSLHCWAITPFAVYFGVQAIAAIPLPQKRGARGSRSPRWRSSRSSHVAPHRAAVRRCVHAQALQRHRRRWSTGRRQPYAQAAFAAIRTYTQRGRRGRVLQGSGRSPSTRTVERCSPATSRSWYANVPTTS